MIAKLRHFVPYYILRQIYQSLISPYLSYAITVWGSASKCHLNKRENKDGVDRKEPIYTSLINTIYPGTIYSWWKR